MKVVVVGTPRNWDPVEQVMAAMSADDTVAHAGSYALGGKIDRIVARKPRARRPKVEVHFPEVPRYEPYRALEQSALQMLRGHEPLANVVVWVSETDDEDEVRAARSMAERWHVPVEYWEDWVAARTGQRP